MSFTRGLMLTCGAVGGALAVVAITGLSVGERMPGLGSEDAPETVTLLPIVLNLGVATGEVQVSLSLTVPSAEEREFICAREESLLATAARVVRNEVVGRQSGDSVPGDLDRSLRAYIDRILGDRRVEGLEITVTPAGATPPRPNCS